MKYSVDSQYLDDFMENGKLTSLKVIDTHTHMGDIHGASEPIHEIDDCIKLMDHENIESIWCAPHPDLFGQNGINNIIKAIMKKYPSRVKGYFGYNPNYGEEYAGCFHEILENPNFIGFKILPAYHNYSLDGEAYIAALEFADKHSLRIEPIFFVINPKLRE